MQYKSSVRRSKVSIGTETVQLKPRLFETGMCYLLTIRTADPEVRRFKKSEVKRKDGRTCDDTERCLREDRGTDTC